MVDGMSEFASNPVSSSPEAPVLRLRSPADVVEAVPYLVGFHPDHSIVVLCLSRRPKLLRLTMRQDLPPGRAAPQVAQMLAEHIRRSGGDLVVVACYPEGADERAAAERAVEELRARLDGPDCQLKEAVRVEDGRWWSYLCTEPRCCPPEGTPIAAEPGQVAAAAVLGGHVALPSRASLPERLKPANQIARLAVLQALGATEQQRDEAEWMDFAAGLLARYHDEQSKLTPQEAARLLVGLQDVRLRDECATWWYEPARNRESVGLWTDAVRHAPPGYVAAPATLLAVSAWLAGQGAFGNIALDRALADDPAYRLALLMDAVIQSGVSPSQFRATRFDPAEDRPRRRGRRRRPSW
jgi:hypothetical protein